MVPEGRAGQHGRVSATDRTTSPTSPTSNPTPWLALLGFLVAVGVAAGLGGLAASSAGSTYDALEQPAFAPPAWVFGPVWTVLYTLMSVAAWLVWRRRGEAPVRGPLAAYVVQLVLNAIWTPVFFGLYPAIGSPALWIALVIILALDVTVLVTMIRFWKVSKAAAWLLVPYWAWVLFATTLNAALAVLN